MENYITQTTLTAVSYLGYPIYSHLGTVIQLEQEQNSCFFSYQYDADDEIADQSQPSATDDNAGKPSGYQADDQEDDEMHGYSLVNGQVNSGGVRWIRRPRGRLTVELTGSGAVPAVSVK